jgi:hypothetical protein
MIIYSIWFFSKPFLLLLCGSYVLSGIVVRLVGSIRRHFFPRRGIEESAVDPDVRR